MVWVLQILSQSLIELFSFGLTDGILTKCNHHIGHGMQLLFGILMLTNASWLETYINNKHPPSTKTKSTKIITNTEWKMNQFLFRLRFSQKRFYVELHVYF